MAFPASIVIQHQTESGRWDELWILNALLHPISKPQLPPRGGHRFTCTPPALKSGRGLQPGMRALLPGGIFWDVVRVDPEPDGQVTVLLGHGTAQPAGSVPAPGVTAVECRGLFRDGKGMLVTSIFVDRRGNDVILRHDYKPEEFSPQPGWTVEGRDFKVKITSVIGRELFCVPVLVEG